MRPSPRRDVGGLHSAVGDPAMERVQRPVVRDRADQVSREQEGEDVGRGAVRVRGDVVRHGGGAHVRHEEKHRLVIAPVPLPAVPAAVLSRSPYPVGRELPATLSYDNPTMRDAQP